MEKENPQKSIVKKYIHDIKNFRKLSAENIKNINNLNYDDRLEVLHAYNDMVEYFDRQMNKFLYTQS